MNDGPEVLDELIWDPTPVLQPGMDFHDGTTYFTVPIKRRVLKPAKKKDADPTLVEELHTYVVSSDREGIWYDADSLTRHGFSPKKQFVQQDQPKWSLPSVRAFLENEANGPPSQALFTLLRTIYTTYAEFADEMYYDIMSLYVMYTYVFRLFDSTGYIHFNGTAASGKSRNLSILNSLAFNTIWASSMSASALFRSIAGSPGTTCFDETEGFDGERGEELRRILNAGYRNGSTVQRSEKNAQDRWETTPYDTYGPKTLASIKPLEDVIASRCIVVAMRPALRELPDFRINDPEWQQVRDQLYLWALENTEAINALNRQWQDTTDTGKKKRLAPKLISRQWEITAQYIVLADYVGGEPFASSLIEFFNTYFTKQQEQADATDRIRTTLRCLPRVLATKAAHPGNFYSVKDIHEVVTSYMDTDAAEYFKTKHVTANLKPLGFTKIKRAAGGNQVCLDETTVRSELTQRRVAPFPEDEDWLAGTRTYQHPTGLFDSTPKVVLHDKDKPFWETEEDEDV